VVASGTEFVRGDDGEELKVTSLSRESVSLAMTLILRGPNMGGIGVEA
jgi:hypothetical protein